jgi:hypothetical protein
VLFIASRLRPPGDTIKSPIASPGRSTTLDQCTDTKITVGFSLGAAETESDIVDCTTNYAVRRAVERGFWRLQPGIARTPHHAREARASYRHREFRGDYAEGLGRDPTGLFPANAEKQEV